MEGRPAVSSLCPEAAARPSHATPGGAGPRCMGDKYLGAYAREMVWREDTRRRPNGTLHALAAGTAHGQPVSRMWKGYRQRAAR